LGTDVALSFQESSGCSTVWEQIGDVCRIINGAYVVNSSSQPIGQNSEQHLGRQANGVAIDADHSLTKSDEFNFALNAFAFVDANSHHNIQGGVLETDLPNPRLETIGEVAKILSEATLFQREALARQALIPGFLSALLAVFKTAEDLEDESLLLSCNAAVKSLISLNESSLLETLFSDEYADGVIGALEYDSNSDSLASEQQSRHRDYVLGAGAPKEIIPITDPSLRAKIALAHRMGYVKDNVLPRSFEDSTFATLSSLQLFNQVEVVASLQSDPYFYPELFNRLQGTSPGSCEWCDLVGLLQETVSLARHMQLGTRNALLSRLVALGLFPTLAKVLQFGDDVSRLRAAEVLLADVAHDATPLRLHLQGEGASLFAALTDSLLGSTSTPGLQEQMLEILKILLDPDTMESSGIEKDKFIDIFYEQHIKKLLDTVVASSSSTSPATTCAKPGTLMLVLDLLCYCVTQHSYRIKYYILRNNVVEKVLRLLKRRERTVATAALRFLRTCLAMRDEFYNRYIVKNSLLEPVLAAYLENGQKYNLLNSAILELLEFLRRENLRGLVAAVVESPRWEAVEKSSVAYNIDTFRQLVIRHEMNFEGNYGGSLTVELTGQQGQKRQREETEDDLVGSVSPLGMDTSKVNRPSISTHEAVATAAARAEAAAQERRVRGEKEEDIDEDHYFAAGDEGDEEAEPVAATGPASTLSTRPALLGLPHRIVDYDEDDEGDARWATLEQQASKRKNKGNGDVTND
jgi:protein phosphatase-4 regulatory subunit 3